MGVLGTREGLRDGGADLFLRTQKRLRGTHELNKGWWVPDSESVTQLLKSCRPLESVRQKIGRREYRRDMRTEIVNRGPGGGRKWRNRGRNVTYGIILVEKKRSH